MDDQTSVFKIFTPTTPAHLTFIERDDINERLVNALRTPGKQLVIYGHSGSGKSTILTNKLEQLYESQIISRCMQGMSFEQLILDAFDQLSPYYTMEGNLKKTDTTSVSIKGSYLGIQSQLSNSLSQENSVKYARILPPQLTLQNLAKFMGQVNCCWILEDFHKIDAKDRVKLSQAMKIFVDMAGDYPDLKIIAIGAVDSARQVVEYDNEMRTRVAEIHIPLMDVHQLQDIIVKGTKLMNIKFATSLTTTISYYAAGLPSICHHLCLNICIHLGLDLPSKASLNINKQSLQPAIKMYLDEASDTLKMAFENTFKQQKVKKYNNAKLIIKALSELPQEGGTRADIYRKIIKDEDNYPQGNLTTYLKKMCEAEATPLIRSSADSGKFAFIDPLYRAFAIALFSHESQINDEPKQPIDWNTAIANFVNNFDSEALTKTIYRFAQLSVPKKPNIDG